MVFEYLFLGIDPHRYIFNKKVDIQKQFHLNLQDHKVRYQKEVLQLNHLEKADFKVEEVVLINYL